MRAAIALAVLGVLGAFARPAHACSKRHQTIFELFDQSPDVAVVKVGAIPRAHYAGPVRLRVTRRLKGPARATLTAIESNSSCAIGLRAGRAALIFLPTNRRPDDESYFEAPSPALLATLAAWAKAAAPADRAALLVTTATGSDQDLARDAAMFLADDPALVSTLTEADAAALAAPTADPYGDELRALVVARTHGKAWRALIAAGLPPRSRVLAALAAHDDEAITDVAVLADIIATTPGEEAPARIAALERCERLHGARLEELTTYGNGRAAQWWLKLAVACRTGTPPTI
ncbi:MAG: hypothetical protein K8W52_40885 [Deltaproteobacteria bacterium]|nr:hypothetical protein [Deltaproteobacteria bacterium]